jgi:hypothetical protein
MRPAPMAARQGTGAVSRRRLRSALRSTPAHCRSGARRRGRGPAARSSERPASSRDHRCNSFGVTGKRRPGDHVAFGAAVGSSRAQVESARKTEATPPPARRWKITFPPGQVALWRDGEPVRLAGGSEYQLPGGRFGGGDGQFPVAPFQAQQPAAQAGPGVDAQQRPGRAQESVADPDHDLAVGVPRRDGGQAVGGLFERQDNGDISLQAAGGGSSAGPPAGTPGTCCRNGGSAPAPHSR